MDSYNSEVEQSSSGINLSSNNSLYKAWLKMNYNSKDNINTIIGKTSIHGREKNFSKPTSISQTSYKININCEDVDCLIINKYSMIENASKNSFSMPEADNISLPKKNQDTKGDDQQKCACINTVDIQEVELDSNAHSNVINYTSIGSEAFNDNRKVSNNNSSFDNGIRDNGDYQADCKTIIVNKGESLGKEEKNFDKILSKKEDKNILIKDTTTKNNIASSILNQPIIIGKNLVGPTESRPIFSTVSDTEDITDNKKPGKNDHEFLCHHENCTKSFRNKKYLLQHEKIHRKVLESSKKNQNSKNDNLRISSQDELLCKKDFESKEFYNNEFNMKSSDESSKDKKQRCELIIV